MSVLVPEPIGAVCILGEIISELISTLSLADEMTPFWHLTKRIGGKLHLLERGCVLLISLTNTHCSNIVVCLVCNVY